MVEKYNNNEILEGKDVSKITKITNLLKFYLQHDNREYSRKYLKLYGTMNLTVPPLQEYSVTALFKK